VYLKAEKEEITLKQGAIEICFPLIRWKMFETYLEDVDEAVEQIRNNRYSSVMFLFVTFSFLTLQISSFLFVGFRFLTLQISLHFAGFRFLTLQISFHFVGTRIETK
jgi:hypothetical protein